MTRTYVDLKQIRFTPGERIDASDFTNLHDFLISIDERMKKLEDDFHDHILLRQELTTEKK